MTPTEYRKAGYRVSLQVPQELINRLETEVQAAYITPIAPTLATTDDLYKRATMTLAFALMVKRNLFATRSGAKMKQSPENSSDPEVWYNTDNINLDCNAVIQELRKTQGAVKDAEFVDVIGIYFKTNFWHN
ncbi:MAG: hypothetical protein IIZ78_18400 [Clostridiales bacterium]|jgi:hypothetical protein|nr:hypothetical protein [Clostridiales bacterium]